MRIAICEDSQTTLQYYEYLINQLAQKHGVPAEVMPFHNGNDLLFYLDLDDNPIDLIYLDIEMPKKNGVEVANELRETVGYKGEIIFLTGHPEAALDGYGVQAYQYLLKDQTNRKRFEAVFLEVVEKISRRKKRYLLLKGNGEFRNIDVDSIYYFEIRQKKVTIYYGDDETFGFYMSLAELQEQLEPYACYRVHRSFIVKISNIVRKDGNLLFLKNGASVPIGRTYTQEVKAYMQKLGMN
ncbi:LytR/AlgR family response regulator transcription factor [Eubacterium barkeri]|uniref:Stage 0 sporulation protein A homolog n=1 Tax=Eubacterium barkeri TaxID=1528 RepID=A0A1H3HY75_EUBBA|nr:LytTR family DNA-binding domain-containing protein [Eubacterium barkeri]SDY20430.1 DNA-binding response regulator, LytR/AlgR family [Eubacterium barkeri]